MLLFVSLDVSVWVFSVMYGHFFSMFANHQIRHRPHVKWVIAWWLHIVTLIFFKGLCGCVWFQSLYHPWGFTELAIDVCHCCRCHCLMNGLLALDIILVENPMIVLYSYIYKALMLGHGGSSAGSYLADPTSPIPSHCAVIIYIYIYIYIYIACICMIS